MRNLACFSLLHLCFSSEDLVFFDGFFLPLSGVFFGPFFGPIICKINSFTVN